MECGLIGRREGSVKSVLQWIVIIPVVGLTVGLLIWSHSMGSCCSVLPCVRLDTPLGAVLGIGYVGLVGYSWWPKKKRLQ